MQKIVDGHVDEARIGAIEEALDQPDEKAPSAGLVVMHVRHEDAEFVCGKSAKDLLYFWKTDCLLSSSQRLRQTTGVSSGNICYRHASLLFRCC